MGKLLAETDSGVLAAILALAMFVAWWYGCRVRRRAGLEEASADKFTDASLAVLGLLLAFTFGMSLDKHNQRRMMVVADANAIGDFYTCSSLLKDPVRTILRTTIKQYTEHRLALVRDRLDESRIQEKLDEIQNLHNRMQEQVGIAVDGGTPIVQPLVNTLNALTSNHASRLAASRNRLPFPIVALLLVASVIAAYLVGTDRGRPDKPLGGSAVWFILLVAMVVWVTLDLNQPNRGLITVDQEPMERVLAGMG